MSTKLLFYKSGSDYYKYEEVNEGEVYHKYQKNDPNTCVEILRGNQLVDETADMEKIYEDEYNIGVTNTLLG
jgi:hypothetical protein